MQIVEAMRGQQKAGYVHGALKLANCVVYEEADGSYSGKLIHLGMSDTLKPLKFTLKMYKKWKHGYDAEKVRM